MWIGGRASRGLNRAPAGPPAPDQADAGGGAGLGRPRARRQGGQQPQPQASAHTFFPQVLDELHAPELLEHAAEELGLRAGRGGRSGGRGGIMEALHGSLLTLVLLPATTKSRELAGSSMESDMAAQE